MDEQQLRQIESLCRDFYETADAGVRRNAEVQILQLQTDFQFIPHCQFLLDNSALSFARAIAAQSLEVLISKFWTSLTPDQKRGMRMYVLNYLASNAQQLDMPSLRAMTKLTARITKLGWFDGPEYRDIVTDVTKFFESTSAHHLVGLLVLSDLITEMNSQTASRSVTQQRKTSVSFRDNALYEMFQLGIHTLSKVKGMSTHDPLRAKLAGQGLELVNQCLSFDFLGTNADESTDEVSSVQVPLSWRPFIQDVGTMELLFDMYRGTDAPQSAVALSAIGLLLSVRRTLFSGDAERTAFLNVLMAGIGNIMFHRHGLDEEDNYHAFCQVLGRLKAAFQLNELMKVPQFGAWLDRAKDFTLETMREWADKKNSIHYCVALWSRLIAALPYLRADERATELHLQAQHLRQCASEVVQCFIQTMLQSVEVVVETGEDDPLEDETNMQEALERLPALARIQYDTISSYLLGALNQSIDMFRTMCASSPSVLQQNLAQVQTTVGKLTWLVYFIASVVGVSAIAGPGSVVNADTAASELMADGSMCRGVFALINLITQNVNTFAAGAAQMSGGQHPLWSPRLELAIMHFLRQFKKLYLGDSLTALNSRSANVDGVSGGSGSSLASRAQALGSAVAAGLFPYQGGGAGGVGGSGGVKVPGGSTAHPLLMGVLSGGGQSAWGDDAPDMGASPATATNIFDAIGPGVDAAVIMKEIVEKMCGNIRFWASSEELLKETLELFVEFVGAYGSGKALLDIEAVQFMILNHTGENFPFLAYDGHSGNNKHRVDFYSALARLVFASSEDLNNCFDAFIAPKIAFMGQLSSQADISPPGVRMALVTALRDLKGICISAYSRRTYVLFFESVFPHCFPLLLRAAEGLYGDALVITAVLKFLKEFVYNKGQRIFFEQSSANGILLFRETSKIICAYGTNALQVTHPEGTDLYAAKYKMVRTMLDILTNAFGGGYVNFGVFALYSDPSLQNALDVSLQLCLGIPLEDIMVYPKLTKSFFTYLEILFRHHLEVLCQLGSEAFVTLISKNNEGLQCGDPNVVNVCAMTLDHVASFVFLQSKRLASKPVKPSILLVQQHFQSEPELLPMCMNTLFNVLLYSSAVTVWAVTRPILSLMLSYPDAFNAYREYLHSTQQSPEAGRQLHDEFQLLLEDVQHSLDMQHRDKFTSKLTVFRTSVRAFLNI